MISVRFLHRDEWEAKLRAYGCKPLEGRGSLNTAELWQAPWGGFWFTVPVEDEDRCEEWAPRRRTGESLTEQWPYLFAALATLRSAAAGWSNPMASARSLNRSDCVLSAQRGTTDC